MPWSTTVQDRERDKFAQTTAGETAVRTLIDPDSSVSLSGSVSAAAPTGPFKITVGTATDVAANPLASPLNNRVNLSIRNLSATDTIYFGANALVTPDTSATGGWEIGPGEDFHITLDDSNSFYFVTEAGKTALWKIMEIASTASGGGGPTVNHIQEQAAGIYDGVNDTFTISQTPADSADFILFVNGNFRLQGTHYTLAGTTITMVTPPEADQVIEVSYTY